MHHHYILSIICKVDSIINSVLQVPKVERLNKLPKVTQPATPRAGTGFHTVRFQRSGPYSLTSFFLLLHKPATSWEKIHAEFLSRFLAPQTSRNQGRESCIHYTKSCGYSAPVNMIGDRKRDKELYILILLRTSRLEMRNMQSKKRNSITTKVF